MHSLEYGPHPEFGMLRLLSLHYAQVTGLLVEGGTRDTNRILKSFKMDFF